MPPLRSRPAGATTAVGASQTFNDPRWRFSQTNELFEVYACDGSDADCAPGGQAGARAPTYCSDKDWLNDKGLLTWVAGTRSLGDNSREFPAVQSFKIDQATEKWAKVQPSPGGYETGDGGFVFIQIVCGDGSAPEPTAEEGDQLTLTIKIAGRRVFKPKAVRDTPARQLSRVEVKGTLKVKAGVDPDSPILKRGDGLDLPEGTTITGIVSVQHYFRACLDFACTVSRQLKGKKTVRLRANTNPNAVNPLFRSDSGEKVKGQLAGVRRANVSGRPWDGGAFTAARVASSQLPESQCKKGAPGALAAVRDFRRKNALPIPITSPGERPVPRGQTFLVTVLSLKYCSLPRLNFTQRTINRATPTNVQRIALPMNGRFIQSAPGLV